MGILTHYFVYHIIFVYQCGIVAILYTVIFLDSGIYPQISGDMGYFSGYNCNRKLESLQPPHWGKGALCAMIKYYKVSGAALSLVLDRKKNIQIRWPGDKASQLEENNVQ